MGVDAKILVKHKGVPLSEEQVKKLAVEVAQICGPGNFFIDPMGVHGWRGEPSFALEIIEPETEDEEYMGQVVFYQDGPDIIAEPGEQFLNVNLAGRYYGPGYERGSWPDLSTILRCLRLKIPGGEVWYGGDSSGICAQLVDDNFLKEMDNHFFTVGRGPYVHYSFRDEVHPNCPGCGVPLADVGGGGDRKFYWCDACDNHFVHHGGSVLAQGLYLCDRRADGFERWAKPTHKFTDGKAVKLL